MSNRLNQEENKINQLHNNFHINFELFKRCKKTFIFDAISFKIFELNQNEIGNPNGSLIIKKNKNFLNNRFENIIRNINFENKIVHLIVSPRLVEFLKIDNDKHRNTIMEFLNLIRKYAANASRLSTKEMFITFILDDSIREHTYKENKIYSEVIDYILEKLSLNIDIYFYFYNKRNKTFYEYDPPLKIIKRLSFTLKDINTVELSETSKFFFITVSIKELHENLDYLWKIFLSGIMVDKIIDIIYPIIKKETLFYPHCRAGLFTFYLDICENKRICIKKCPLNDEWSLKPKSALGKKDGGFKFFLEDINFKFHNICINCWANLICGGCLLTNRIDNKNICRLKREVISEIIYLYACEYVPYINCLVQKDKHSLALILEKMRRIYLLNWNKLGGDIFE